MAKYTVKSGDNLTKIAKRFSTTVNAIVNANKNLIKNPSNIKVGWVLEIPSKTNNTVQSVPTVSKPSETETKKAFREFLTEVETLPSYKKLVELIGDV